MSRALEIACLLCLLLLLDCSTPDDLPALDAWNDTLAQYRQQPINRALAVNISPDDANSPFRYYWVWGRPSPEEAAHDALEICDRSLPRDHTRPRACKLVATNDTFHFRREDLGIDTFKPGT
ncbi:MAG TPA: hypothetical protein VN802_12065 [Stellaceae bacterium]|nr:hypothetical protein [Stellaceae bacterium]